MKPTEKIDQHNINFKNRFLFSLLNINLSTSPRSFLYSAIHPFIHSFVYSFIQSFIHSFQLLFSFCSNKQNITLPETANNELRILFTSCFSFVLLPQQATAAAKKINQNLPFFLGFQSKITFSFFSYYPTFFHFLLRKRKH